MRKLAILLVCFSLAFCVSTGSSVLAADEEPAQQLLSFSYFQVKPGMMPEFSELVKSMFPLLKEMGVTEMDTFKVENFGMWDKYLFISPLPDPASMDAQLAQQRSTMMPVSIVSLISGMSRMVVSAQDFVLIPQSDLDILPADGYEFKLLAGVTIGTAPGSDKEFKKGIKKVINAIGKTDVKGVLIGRVGLGGNLDEYILYALYDSFKEMLDNEVAIQKALGAMDLASLDKVTRYRESEVFVRIPELCFKAAAK